MELGTLGQWVTLVVSLLVAAFGFWKWLDKKLDDVYKTREEARLEIERRLTVVRSEAFAQAARASQEAASAIREVARLELEMVKRMANVITQTELDRTLDRYFNPFFLRMDTMERKWERYVDAKLKAHD